MALLCLSTLLVQPTGANEIDDPEILIILTLSAAVADSTTDLQTLLSKMAETRAEKAALREAQEALKSMKAELQSLFEAYQTLEEQLDLFKKMIGDAQSDRDDLEEKIKALDEQIQKLKETARKMDELAEKIEELLPQFLAFLAADADDEDAAQAKIVVIRADLTRLLAVGPPKLTAFRSTPTSGAGGQSELEDRLESFADANAGNPEARDALEQLVGQIRANPQQATSTPTRTPTLRPIPTTGAPKPVLTR